MSHFEIFDLIFERFYLQSEVKDYLDRCILNQNNYFKNNKTTKHFYFKISSVLNMGIIETRVDKNTYILSIRLNSHLLKLLPDELILNNTNWQNKITEINRYYQKTIGTIPNIFYQTKDKIYGFSSIRTFQSVKYNNGQSFNFKLVTIFNPNLY